MRAVCIHGHFYQPPRENPWTGVIDRQPSAAPYDDWNQRIAAECYTPNCAAPILNASGQVADQMNTYRYISFNFGPTLLRWFDQHAPEITRALVEADKASARDNDGHGNAIAQGYHHAILPLANQRDKATEIRWGIADFTHRFGRSPEGMWLPEAAADVPSLEALAAQGLKFVILAPEQAARVRQTNSETWTEVDADTVDTTRPYEIALPSGKSIVAFFYDAAPSQGVAFGGWLHNGETMAAKLSAHTSGIYHLATDGESYGHHHKKGDMGLAYCLKTLLEDDQVSLTNYGAYLAANPPTWSAEIVDPSAWSCAHGVGRWSENCGCAIDPKRAGSQEWRRTLRDALNQLRNKIDPFYEAQASAYGDPWDLRDRYIYDLLSGHEDPMGPLAQLRHQDTAELEQLLELQRQRLMMFTSCGWFFDDPAGLETVQILRYAQRAIALLRDLGGPDIEAQFIEALTSMGSAMVETPSGDLIYTTLVSAAAPQDHPLGS